MALARPLTSFLPLIDRPMEPRDVDTPPSRGPKRKLPRMNASERAKYYRRRVREYMESLEAADDALTRDVQHLNLLRTIQQRLVELGVIAARSQILAHIWQFLDEEAYLKQHVLATPRFDVHSLSIYGDDDGGVIIHLDVVVSGAFAQTTVEQQLYPFIPGNARLLDKLLRTTLQFPSAFRFYFDVQGELVQHTGDTDFAAALVETLECSASEARQLLQALGEPDATHLTGETEPRPRPTLAFLDQTETK